MKRALLFLLSILITTSCSNFMEDLTSDGREVEVVDRKPKSKKCNPVAKVEGINEEGSEEMAVVHARNLAGEKEADQLYIDDTIEQGKLRRVLATAYKCD